MLTTETKQKVYLAGPFFNPRERKIIEEFAKILVLVVKSASLIVVVILLSKIASQKAVSIVCCSFSS